MVWLRWRNYFLSGGTQYYYYLRRACCSSLTRMRTVIISVLQHIFLRVDSPFDCDQNKFQLFPIRMHCTCIIRPDKPAVLARRDKRNKRNKRVRSDHIITHVHSSREISWLSALYIFHQHKSLNRDPNPTVWEQQSIEKNKSLNNRLEVYHRYRDGSGRIRTSYHAPSRTLSPRLGADLAGMSRSWNGRRCNARR
jgi:hypothetical protein